MASKRAYENVLNGTENEHMPLTPRTVALPRKRVNTSQSRHPLTNQNFSGVDDGVDETKQSCDAFNESGSSSISQDKPVPVSSPEEKYTSNSQSNVSFPTRLFSVESTPLKDRYDGNLTSGTQGNNDSTICFSPGALYKSNPPTADRNISVVSTSYSYSYSFTGLFSTPNAHGQDNSILSKNGSEMATFNDSSNPDSGEDLFEVISSQTEHVDAPPVEDTSVDVSIHSSLAGGNDTSTSFPSNTQMFSANRGSTQEYKDCDAESLIGYSRYSTNVSSVSMAPFENTQETTGNDTSLVNMEDSELKSEAGNNSGEAVVLSNSPHILHGGHDVSENNDTTTGNDSVNLPSSSNNLDASVDNVTKTNVLDISIKKENPNESIFSQANNSVNITIPNLFNEGSPSNDNIGTSMDIGHDNVAIKLELSSTTSETYHCVLENDKSTNNVEEEMAVETAKTTDSLVLDECISIVHVHEEVSSSEDQMVILDKSENSPVSDHMDVETHSSSTPSRISNNDLPVKSNLDRSTYSNSQNVSRICDVSHDSTNSSRNVGDDVNCVNRSTVFDDSNSCMASNVTTCTLLPEYSSSSLQINDTVSNSTSEVGNVTVAGDVLAVMNDLKHNVSTLSDSCSKKTDGTYLDLLDKKIDGTFTRYNEEINSLQEQLREQKEINSNNYSHFTKIKSELDQALEKLASNDKEFAKTKSEYETEISMLKGSVDELKKVLSEKNKEVSSLKELNSTYNKISIALDKRIDVLKKERDSLEKELKNKTANSSDLQKQLTAANDTLQKYRDEIVNHENSIKSINASFGNCQKELSEIKISIANKDEVIAKLEKTVADLTKEKEEFELTVERLTVENDKITEENEKLNDVNNQLSKDLSSIESQVRDAEQKAGESKMEQGDTSNEFGKIVTGSINDSIRSSTSSFNDSVRGTMTVVIEGLKDDYGKLLDKVNKIALDKTPQKENITKITAEIMSSLKEIQKELSQEKMKMNNILSEMNKQHTVYPDGSHNSWKNEELFNLNEIIPSIRQAIHKLSEVNNSKLSEGEFKQKLDLLSRENADISKNCEDLRIKCINLESSVDNITEKERKMAKELLSLRIKNMEYEIKLGLLTPEAAAEKCCDPEYSIEYFQKVLNNVNE